MPYNLSEATEKIQVYIGLYKELMEGKAEKQYNELNKWRTAKVFRDKWKLEAVNFSEMIEACFTPQSNLTVGQNYYPVKMLREFSEMDTEGIRSIIKNLIDESKDVQERINNTEKSLDDVLARYRIWKNNNLNHHYINERFLSVLLYFIYPDKYYLYKFSMFKKFCTLFSLSLPKKGADENFINYCELCNEVKQILEKDKEVVNVNKSLLDKNCFSDDSLHLLTQDFIYACTSYLSSSSEDEYTECKLPQK